MSNSHLHQNRSQTGGYAPNSEKIPVSALIFSAFLLAAVFGLIPALKFILGE